MTKTNETKKEETIKILSAEEKKAHIDNLTFNSVAVEFKTAKFEKYISNKYLLNKEERKEIKNEMKKIKNIDFISNIEYSNGNTKSTAKVTNHHLGLFVDNFIKFTKNDFDKILASIDKTKQLELLQGVLLDYSKKRNNTTKTTAVVVSGANTIMRRFTIAVVTEYCKG